MGEGEGGKIDLCYFKNASNKKSELRQRATIKHEESKITESQVYWWIMLDSISCYLTILTIITSIALVVMAIGWLIDALEDYDSQKTKRKVCFWLLVACFVIHLPCVFLPSSKQYAVIKILPKIANSDIAKEIPSDMKDMYSMAKDYLKEKIAPE